MTDRDRRFLDTLGPLGSKVFGGFPPLTTKKPQQVEGERSFPPINGPVSTIKAKAENSDVQRALEKMKNGERASKPNETTVVGRKVKMPPTALTELKAGKDN